MVAAVGALAHAAGALGDAAYREAPPPLQQAYATSWRWQSFSTDDGLPSMQIQQVIETDHGTPWVVTGGGIAWFDGYRWHALQAPDLLGQRPSMIARAGEDRILIVHDRRLFVGDRHGLEEIPIADRFLGIVAAAALPDGTIFLTGRREVDPTHRLYRLAGESAVPVDSPPLAGLPARPFVRTSRAGRLWLGCADGAYRREVTDAGSTWVGPIGGWESAAGPALLVVENARGEGLVALPLPHATSTVSEWRTDGIAETAPRFVNRDVVAADVAPSGDAIVAIESPWVRTRINGAWDAMRSRDAHRSISALRFRSNGDLWLGTPHGLYLYHGSITTWNRWHKGHPGPGNRAATLLATRDGSLWMGTRGRRRRRPGRRQQ